MIIKNVSRIVFTVIREERSDYVPVECPFCIERLTDDELTTAIVRYFLGRRVHEKDAIWQVLEKHSERINPLPALPPDLENGWIEKKFLSLDAEELFNQYFTYGRGIKNARRK